MSICGSFVEVRYRSLGLVSQQGEELSRVLLQLAQQLACKRGHSQASRIRARRESPFLQLCAASPRFASRRVSSYRPPGSMLDELGKEPRTARQRRVHGCVPVCTARVTDGTEVPVFVMHRIAPFCFDDRCDGGVLGLRAAHLVSFSCPLNCSSSETTLLSS